MKILAIRLKNLASMEGETEIDFTSEPLCSAGIFAITGPTGAGKSTILDALCLALYAKTPRYMQGKEAGIEVKELNQGDVRGILRNGSGDGFAEVDFIGIDDNKYRATWAVKRARNKPEGAIQKDTLSIKNLNSGIMVTAMKTEACREIERLVGLSFDQFTRSVLLAQGDFTAFLKADNNDKASLLEKLTGTTIYSKISQQVFNNYKNAQTVIDHLNARLAGFRLLSEEEVESEKNRQHDINIRLSQVHEQLEVLQNEIKWQEKKIQLSEHIEVSTTALNNAKQRKEDASNRFTELKWVEEAQKIRSPFEMHHSLEEQSDSEKQTLESTRKELATLQSAIEDSDTSIASYSNEFTVASNLAAKTLPEINEARRLDVQLSEQEKNVHLFQKRFADADEKLKEQQQRLSDLRQQREDIRRTITALQEWKNKNIDREPIATNIVLIQSKLEEARRILLGTSDLSQILDSKKGEAKKSGDTINWLQLEVAEIQKNSQRLTAERDVLEDNIKGFNITQLDKARKECGLYLERLISAQASWKMLYEKRNTLQDIQKHHDRLIQERETINNRLGVVEQLLPGMIEKKTASDQRLTRAKLEISKNVASLREQLHDHEPCPVCGSKDHPYRDHHPEVTGILSLLEEEALRDFEQWNSLINEKQHLAESNKQAVIELQRIERQRSETSLRAEQLHSEWTAFQLDHPALADSEINAWLITAIANSRNEQQELTEKIEQHNTFDARLKEHQQWLVNIEKKQQVLQQQIHLETANLDSCYTRVKELEKEVQQKQGQCDGLINNLNIYFTQPSWSVSWKEGHTKFLQKLDGFAKEWSDKVSQLETAARNKGLVENSIVESTLHIKERQAEFDSRKQEYHASMTLFEELQLKRKSFFDGKSADEVESSLQKDIDAAGKQMEQAKSKRQELAEKIAGLNSVVTQVSASITHKEKSIADLAIKISNWISQFHRLYERELRFDQLHELLHFSHDWIEQEQSSLKEIERRIIEAEANLRDRHSEMQQHNGFTKYDRDLQAALAEREIFKSEKAGLEESFLNIKFKLEADTLNKKNAGSIAREIEVASLKADNWAKLNEIIGSADGKKFRQAAQEYTLDVLLVFANVQLAALSRRYEIRRIENTLGLLVVDKDMGDEERTVVSLSGGESFLISLALALGLASLSSSRMKVESLFIDEGFGSLDPATLNIAMDALEKLHNQGRKVGVISHVREMQERITTQIKVVKQSTGRSIITIENGLN